MRDVGSEFRRRLERRDEPHCVPTRQPFTRRAATVPRRARRPTTPIETWQGRGGATDRSLTNVESPVVLPKGGYRAFASRRPFAARKCAVILSAPANPARRRPPARKAKRPLRRSAVGHAACRCGRSLRSTEMPLQRTDTKSPPPQSPGTGGLGDGRWHGVVRTRSTSMLPPDVVEKQRSGFPLLPGACVAEG